MDECREETVEDNNSIPQKKIKTMECSCENLCNEFPMWFKAIESVADKKLLDMMEGKRQRFKDFHEIVQRDELRDIDLLTVKIMDSLCQRDVVLKIAQSLLDVDQ